MPNEITPDQLEPEVQQRTAELLRRTMRENNPASGEIAAAQFNVDDAINILQLALAASQADRHQAEQAVTMIYNWVRWLAYGNTMHMHMLWLFEHQERDRIERQLSILTRELRLCSQSIAFGRGFRIEAIKAFRGPIERPIRTMTLGLRQRDARRRELKALAQVEFRNTNRVQALVNTIAGAISIVDREHRWMIDRRIRPDYVMLLDVFAVIIGRDMLSGRLVGDYFAGVFNGSGGFQPHLADRHYQAQHALAGIWIGHQYGLLGKWGAKFLEWCGDEPQDVDLYEVTCELGRDLSVNNYRRLPARLARAIGDNTVTPPP